MEIWHGDILIGDASSWLRGEQRNREPHEPLIDSG